MAAPSDAVRRLRLPEYTGENRCIPCTAVNLALALVVAAGIGVLAPGALSPVLAGAFLLVAVGAVYLRGYLVPGTPWFTRTYFPDPLLRRFDKAPDAAVAPTGADGDLDVEAALVGAGAIEECPDVDDLCPAPGFREAWRARIEDLRESDTSREDLADVLGVDADQLSFSEHGDALVAHHYAVPAGQWESEAALLADVAAGAELAERWDDWDRYDVQERGALLAGLRLFVERCPACDGPVRLGEDVKRSCCRSFDVVAATCEDCGARLLEAERPGDG